MKKPDERRSIVPSALSRLIMLFLVLSYLPHSLPAGDEPAAPSMQALATRAEAKATEGDAAGAAADYRALLERHLENERLFQTALGKLTRLARTEDQQEELVRFLVSALSDYEEKARARERAYSGVIEELMRENPVLIQRLRAEIRGEEAAEEPESADPSALRRDELAGAILQREDAELREIALAKVQSLLGPSTSDAQKLEGLGALNAASVAKFDRQPFRQLVLPLLESEDAQIRLAAVRLLPALEGGAEDIPRVLPLVDDSSNHVREAVGGALIRLGQGERGDLVIPALMALLQDERDEVVEQTIRSMWGQYSSPEFDDLLIDLSYRQGHQHNVIYFCLSPMGKKSVKVCARLVEELSDPDWNNSGRAAWGLNFGVPAEAAPIVEEGLLAALPEETNPYVRRQEFSALQKVASEKSVPYLRSVVESELETEEAKALAREALTKIGG